MRVQAATLAGGSNNQDRYAHGEGWAFVLDGASAFGTETPEHDGGWYAERLRRALSAQLDARPQERTSALIAKAIECAASAHLDPATCPTSTVALARWDLEQIEICVLGDSVGVFLSNDAAEVHTDDRLRAIAPQLRSQYRRRLRSGCGFDEEHRRLLAKLQGIQTNLRNSADGYWIAGSDPQAGQHALSISRPRSEVDKVVLASDGAEAALRYGIRRTWGQLADTDLSATFALVHEAESVDHSAQRWPRSKRHDDKTAIVLTFDRLRISTEGSEQAGRGRGLSGPPRPSSESPRVASARSPDGDRDVSHRGKAAGFTDLAAATTGLGEQVDVLGAAAGISRLLPEGLFRGLDASGLAAVSGFTDLAAVTKRLGEQVDVLGAAAGMRASWAQAVLPGVDVAGIGQGGFADIAALTSARLSARGDLASIGEQIAQRQIRSLGPSRATVAGSAGRVGQYELGDLLDDAGYFYLDPARTFVEATHARGSQVTMRDLEVAERIIASGVTASVASALYAIYLHADGALLTAIQVAGVPSLLEIYRWVLKEIRARRLT